LKRVFSAAKKVKFGLNWAILGKFVYSKVLPEFPFERVHILVQRADGGSVMLLQDLDERGG